MLEYSLLLMLLFSVSPIAIFGGTRGSRVALVVSVSILIAFTSLRYYSASDYASYVTIYELTPGLFDLSIASLSEVPGEWGYLILNSIFKTFNIEAFAFLAFLSFFSIWSKSIIITKFSLSPYCAFVLYFSFVYFNSEYVQIRWALALSFIFIGIFSFLRKKYYISSFFLAMSVTFHVMSLFPILVLVFYGFFKNRIDFNMSLFLVFMSFILGYLIDVPSAAITAFGMLDVLEGNYFIVKLVNYLGVTDEVLAWHVIMRHLITFLFVSVIYFYANKSLATGGYERKLNTSLYYLYSIFLSSCFMVMSFPTLSTRSYLICEMLSAILISNNIYYIRSLFTRYSLFFLVILYAFLCWFWLMMSGYDKGNIYNYNTWLFGLIIMN